MRATIKMIAERAGVSIGTVDRVLHDRPYVKEEARQRVLEAIQALDYRPNRMASALATSGIPRHFAVVQPRWDDYVYQAMALGVFRFREERRDYNISVTTEEYPQERTEDCLRLLDRLAEEPVDGVALCATDCGEVREKVRELAEKNIPVVTFNSDIAGARRLCYVGEDAHRAGRIAGEIASKFYRPGDRMLLVYAGPEYAGHKARIDGFLERLGELGVSPAACRVGESHNSYDQTLAVVSQALAEEPDLRYIYMANLSVSACVEAVRRAGETGRVRVLAHDSSPEIREFLKTGQVDFTIDQDLTFQTWKSLTVLFDLIWNRKRPETEFFTPASPILNAENC